MRILKNIFLFLLLASASMSFAQLTISTDGGEAAMGQNLEVDITANEFNSLSTFQFNVVWDSLVMTFVEVKNVNPDLTSYSVNTNFGIPGDGSIKDGTVTTSWTNFTQAESLADDTRLFTIVLSAIGVECATSSFDFENEEAGDENFVQVDLTSIGGDILVSGPDCGGGGGGDPECVNECEGSTGVILSMPCITAPAGSNICIPITVFNFTDIEAVQGGILWDPTVMEYTGFQNLGFMQMGTLNPNAGFIFNANDSENGMIRQFWSDETGSTPQSLPDGSVLYELCFDLIGDDGDVISIDYGDVGSFGVEVVQLGVGVDFCLDQGTITIGNPPSDPVQLIANDVTGPEGGEACVDISVREFIDIRGYQANLQWDNTIIDYNRVQMLNASLGLTTSNFNFTNNPDNLRFTWDNLNPATLDDNAVLFQVCFDVIGDCESTPTSAVTFENTPTSAIEFSNPDGLALDFTVDNGSVTVLSCGHSCSFVEAIQPSCPGENGSITVSVDADATCECNWFLNGGSTSIQTTPGNGNCNLNTAAAGNYTFELSDASGEIVCTFDQTITDPAAIMTNPSVSNAGCGDTGSITLNATGGTGVLTYTWVPDVSNSDGAMDLGEGDYSITIFDENDCSVNVMLSITAELDPLSVDINSSTIVDPTCNGSGDGSISAAAMGGCPPYMFAYEGGDGTGLLAGDYGVTVTDNNGTTANATLTVNDPQEIELEDVIVNESNSMMDGSITISVIANGTAPYMYNWSPDVSNTETASNLSADTYAVTVTDDSGCTAVLSNLVVLNTNTEMPPSFGMVNVTDIANCFGDKTGSISSTVVDGVAPYTVALSGPIDSDITLASSGSFNFDELFAGAYTLTVTDANGATGTAAVQLSEPSDLEATFNSGDDLNNCDGFIDVEVSGGTQPYTYQWVNDDNTTPNYSNLCAGSYDLVVTDANDCVLMLNFDIDNPNEPDGPCWLPRNIITPNDDGKNDFFTFSCLSERVAALQIFDRYGREVYTSDDYDGTFNGISDSGVVLGEGGYMWVLNIDFGSLGRRIEKGTLTLLRD